MLTALLGGKGNGLWEKMRKKKLPFLPCASGVDLDADSISWMKREVSASYTVEASFVMAVTFFLSRHC